MKNFNNAKVSIISPTFNCEKYIDWTIQSVASQTYENWEMIIIDDCSSDHTVSKVKKWAEKDTRIRVFQNLKNIGPGPSRNKAVSYACGRYIAYLDSDDIWVPSKLSIQLEHMKKTKASLSFTSYELIDLKGHPLGKTVNVPKTLSYNKLLGNTIIGCLTVMIDRHKVQDLNMPSLPSRQPLVLWLKILKEHGPAQGLDKVLAKYRVRPNSVSSNKFAAAKQVWRIYREYENLSLFNAAFYFTLYSSRAFLKNLKARR